MKKLLTVLGSIVLGLFVFVACLAFIGGDEKEEDLSGLQDTDFLIAIFDGSPTVSSMPYAEGYYEVAYKDEDFFDDTNMVNRCISTYINFCKKAYERDSIKNIKMTVYADFISNTNGSTYTNTVAVIDMPRQKIYETQWDNLTGENLWNRFKSECSQCDFHAGTIMRADKSKLYFRSE